MTGSSKIAGDNPFVGPRPLETGQRIFGRDREIEELYYLLSAERIVLLHSPSGAGKSSLIRAGLIPRLAERFDVLGPTRVNTQPPKDAVVNRFVRSANLGFEQGLPEERRRPDDLVSNMTLAEYVERRPRRRSAPQNVVLIFDQFEEILTDDPLAFDAKREFFCQLGKLLQDPRIWALFALREDYLAQLVPYASQVPTHLKNRLRVDLLSRDAAKAAMQGTTQQGGRSFATGAVEQLLTDLATVQVQQLDGRFERQVGPHVEPLHLQVACRGLWERMPTNDLSIDLEDIETFGDVTLALARYYEDVVGALGTAERAVREWVGENLVTQNGIRSQVLKGEGMSEGLDNALVAQLVDAHLVRSEQRSGAVWYELAHDRLVEPVRRSNAQWVDSHLSLLQRQAALWAREGRPDRLLLSARDLALALHWAGENAASLLQVERDLLKRSVARRKARLSALAFIVTLVAGIVSFAWLQNKYALEQQKNNDALLLKVDMFEKEKTAAVTAAALINGQLEPLQSMNAALKDKVSKLDDDRLRVVTAIAALRDDNRKSESKIENFEVENWQLKQRIDALQRSGELLEGEQDDIKHSIIRLTPVPPMLAVQTQALQRRLEGLWASNDELEMLLTQTRPCVSLRENLDESARLAESDMRAGSARGLDFPPAASGTPFLDIIPPPDPAVSDALRRRIKALVQELAALSDEFARKHDELAWFQKANRLLEEQRAALEQELAQLQTVERAQRQRQQSLRKDVKAAEALGLSLQQRIAELENSNDALLATVKDLRRQRRLQEQKVVDTSDWIGLLTRQIERWMSDNGKLVDRMTEIVDHLLRSAASDAQADDLAAMLAVKAYRWAPYDTDGTAQPAVYNGLWLALRRLDSMAASELLAPGDPAGVKLATTRSEVIVDAICRRVNRPFSEAEWRRFMPKDACFTPKSARACP